MNERRIAAVGALALMIAVGTGAFGAHALRRVASPEMVAVWQTAVLYQLVHGLGLLAIAALLPRFSSRLLPAAAWLMLIGIVLFSGSLYVLVLSGVHWLGAVTPIGGSAFIVSWLLVALAALRSR
ncbi:DUF423 domain-containing protein [Paracandidimonas soli]|uniref:Uncharacterized membrane protein YgdD (TMEM256/DUF423 family) n=1 Tax=Paracandidimonas soli TaxID=1917182 RepID=A0A4R3VCI9_9BURK|nr:DUF423 domain-containing protein [Paracandidimonas soli]TCV01318.1 uncharacterized membrane protein YgdD (TMEM256/DUF423 family) [Paracandidimonas soli]